MGLWLRSNAARTKSRLQPYGREQFEASGCVTRSLQVATDMRLARALPPAPTCSRASHSSISTVS